MQRSDGVAVIAVAAGGAAGAVLRYACGAAVPWQPPSFPWATLSVNLVGCFAIGVALVALTEVVAGPGWLRLAIAPGFLGGFTTFSAFAVESVRLADAGAAGAAAGYIAVSVLAGLVLVRIGAVATRRRLVGPVLTEGASRPEEDR
ncbi:MAG: fluoride efflux transporter CrcB [Actinomycetota bacterium]|nr:fluoride efflux transporter CrcB [Actinomycetota bacterium]